MSMPFQTPEELKSALNKPEDLIVNPNVEFFKFAQSLMNNFQIQKGKDEKYWMTDIEFYIYTDSHRDIITYPRNCNAGMWFFHQSGVDISFESKVGPETKNPKKKPVLTRESVFGGILIRGIVKVDDPSVDPDGPLRVCDVLFDKFDAFGKPEGFPQIVLASKARDVIPTQTTRKGRPIKDYAKIVNGILTSNYDMYPPEPDFVSEFKQYWDKGLYRFTAKS